MSEGTELERLVKDAARVPRLFDLSGRAALVVGGTKGLGRAMALALASAGADVCVASRGPGPAGDGGRHLVVGAPRNSLCAGCHPGGERATAGGPHDGHVWAD